MSATIRMASTVLLAVLALAVSGCFPYEDVYVMQPYPEPYPAPYPVPYAVPALSVQTIVVAEPYYPPPRVVVPVYRPLIRPVHRPRPPVSPLHSYARPNPRWSVSPGRPGPQRPPTVAPNPPRTRGGRDDRGNRDHRRTDLRSVPNRTERRMPIPTTVRDVRRVPKPVALPAVHRPKGRQTQPPRPVVSKVRATVPRWAKARQALVVQPRRARTHPPTRRLRPRVESQSNSHGRSVMGSHRADGARGTSSNRSRRR